MSQLNDFVKLAVVAASGIVTIFSVNRDDRPITRIEPAQKPTKSLDWPQDPIVPIEFLSDVRKAELSRRAERPASDPNRDLGLSYDEVLKGKGTRSYPSPAEPMPPTSCRSVEPVPEPEDANKGPYNVHRSTVRLFESESGFGIYRMGYATNDRGVLVESRDIDRVELVSLLTHQEPSVYVLDEMATPPLARQAKRRPLDEFERVGLDAVRFREELVWTRKAPRRMFGAIRAKAYCLECHVNAKKGDLLGAFTYYLKVPADRVRTVWER